MTDSHNHDRTTEHATAEEIREWNTENDEPHPVFDVDHRPERHPVGRSLEDRFVFYIYDDDHHDPRFSFWLETDAGVGMSLYERLPDGRGMWLKPETGSDHAGKAPTDDLKAVIAQLMQEDVSADRVHDLPAHERHFVQVIHGTIEENPDAIPGPVWSWMHDVAEEVAG